MVDPTSGHAAALWVALHVILLTVLSLMVVRQRQKHKIALGHGEVPELERAIRAFGNASEYIPTGLLAVVVMAVVDAPSLAIHVVGFLMLSGRVAHGIGLSMSSGATFGRSSGIFLTWLAYIFAASALLFYAIL